MIPIGDLFGILGSILTIFSYFVPIPDMHRMYKYKGEAVKKFPYLIFIGQILSCHFWVLYGFQIGLLTLKISESIGLVMNLIFILLYVQCLETTSYSKIQLISIWIVTSYVVLIILCFYIEIIIKSYGFLANFFSIFCIFSTIQNIKQVILLKDNAYIAINIVIVYFINYLSWFLYGISLSDINLSICNFIGVVVCGCQIVVYYKIERDKVVFDGGDGKEKEMLVF